VKTGKLSGTVTVQYGDNCTSQRKVYELAEIHKGGRTSDNACSGRPSNVKPLEIKEQIYQRIRDNLTASEIAISHGKKRCKIGLRPS